MFQQGVKIKIFIVESDELSRIGSCSLFSQEPQIEIVGSSASVNVSMSDIEKCCPDVVLLKAEANGEHVLDPIEKLQAACPNIRILVLLELIEERVVARLIQRNVTGVCSARIDLRTLLAAVYATASGSIWYGPRVAETVSKWLAAGASLSGSREREQRYRLEPSLLTERENEILQCMAQGWTNQRIAAELHLSVETVKTYVRRIMDKSAIRTRKELLSCLVQQQQQHNILS